MTLNEVIPTEHHIARLCNPKHHDDEGEIDKTAFILQPKDKGMLSVNWLEFFNFPKRTDQIRKLQEVYSNKFNRVSTNAKIAVLNVGQSCSKVYQNTPDNRIIQIKHYPEENDESHSGIFNMIISDELIPELLRQCIINVKPAKV